MKFSLKTLRNLFLLNLYYLLHVDFLTCVFYEYRKLWWAHVTLISSVNDIYLKDRKKRICSEHTLI